MDRHAAWSGTPGIGLPGLGGRGPRGRVPPRTGQQRPRRGARAASWDGARRWWYIALGVLAAALVLPRLAGAQGLRSRQLSISLRVEAPAHLRAGAPVQGVATRLGASVADVPLLIPRGEFDEAVEARLESASTQPGVAAFVRDPSGALTALGDEWCSLASPAAGGPSIVRFVAAGGAPLEGGAWRVRLRLTPRGGGATVERLADLLVPERR